MPKYNVGYRYVGGEYEIEADNPEDAENKVYEIMLQKGLYCMDNDFLELETTGAKEIQEAV